MATGSKSPKFTKPWHCFLAVGLIVSVCASALLVLRELRLQTDFPAGFTDERFKQITVGMPVEDLFATAGEPFEFIVHSLREGGSWNPPVDWNAPRRYTDVSEAAPYLKNPKNRVVLEYSRPKRGSESFQARQVVIAKGKVISVDAYNFFDD